MSTPKPANGTTFPITACNKKNLAAILGVSVYILNKMIEAVRHELGQPTGTTYCVNQVEFMIQRYGTMKR